MLLSSPSDDISSSEGVATFRPHSQAGHSAATYMSLSSSFPKQETTVLFYSYSYSSRAGNSPVEASALLSLTNNTTYLFFTCFPSKWRDPTAES